MTREQAKKLWPIIKAYSEGKDIQIKCGEYYDWEDAPKSITFENRPWKYRVKPEPKYRPFKNIEECWEEMHKHPDFGWAKNTNGEYLHILSVESKKNYSYWFNLYTFTDGTPFGTKE